MPYVPKDQLLTLVRRRFKCMNDSPFSRYYPRHYGWMTAISFIFSIDGDSYSDDLEAWEETLVAAINEHYSQEEERW